MQVIFAPQPAYTQGRTQPSYGASALFLYVLLTPAGVELTDFL